MVKEDSRLVTYRSDATTNTKSSIIIPPIFISAF